MYMITNKARTRTRRARVGTAAAIAIVTSVTAVCWVAIRNPSRRQPASPGAAVTTRQRIVTAYGKLPLTFDAHPAPRIEGLPRDYCCRQRHGGI